MATQNTINKTSGGITVTGTANINTTGSAISSMGTGGTGATNIGNATGNTAVTGSLTASTTLTATSGNITATNGSIEVGNTAAASTGSDVDFLKSRSSGVISTGDALGTITWQGHDGTQYITGAQIVGVTSGTIATNRIPTSLAFYTHPNSTTAATLVGTFNPGGGLEIATPTSGGNAGILIDGGGITVTAGGATITAGGLTVSAGGAAITGNSTLSGNLTLQSATNGIYTTDASGTPTLLHTYGSSTGYNVFCGQGAGNQTLTTGSATSNTAIGSHSSSNPGPLGSLTTGGSNTALAYQVLRSCTTGSNNTGCGIQSLFHLTTGSDNVALGGGTIVAGSALTSSESSNVCIANTGVVSTSNVIYIGTQGTSAGQQNKCFIAGTYNTAVGATAGVALIDSSNQIGGLAGAANTVLVGGTAPSFTASPSLTNLIVGGNLRLPITASSTIGPIYNYDAASAQNASWIHNYCNETDRTIGYNLFIGRGAGNFTMSEGCRANTGIGDGLAWASGSLAVLASLTTGAQNTACGAATMHSCTSGTANGAYAYASQFSVTTGTNNNSFGQNSLRFLTTGNYNLALGDSAGNAFTSSESSNVCIAHTGTVSTSNIIRIGTQGTGNGQQNKAYIAGIYNTSVGATSNVTLVDSNGQMGGLAGSANTVFMGGTAPSFTGSPSVSGSITAGTSITATAGDVVITAGNLTLATTSSTVGQIVVNGTIWAHSYGTGNTFVGSAAGNTTLTTGSAINNCGYGNSVLTAVTTGQSNSAHGFNTLHSLTTSSYNSAFGNNSLGVLVGGSGQNTALGREAGVQLVSGSNNLLLGYESGRNYAGAESDNIILGTNGTLGDGQTIRLGDAATQTSCFIAGSYGVTVTGSALLMSSSGQLGTVVSSERYKENIEDMGDASSDIMDLRPRIFTYKQTGESAYGLIAEEVDERMPELVLYDKEGNPDAVKYHELPALLLNEIQKLRKRIEVLEAKNGI